MNDYKSRDIAGQIIGKDGAYLDACFRFYEDDRIADDGMVEVFVKPGGDWISLGCWPAGPIPCASLAEAVAELT